MRVTVKSNMTSFATVKAEVVGHTMLTLFIGQGTVADRINFHGGATVINIRSGRHG
jgi:acyl-CoA thioesterase